MPKTIPIQQGPNSDLIFEQIPTGRIKNVAYLVGDKTSGEAVTVDVGSMRSGVKRVLDRVREHGVRVKYNLATHGHKDHAGGAAHIKAETGAPLAAFHTVPNIDVPLYDGDRLEVGRITIEVIHTPGHTADSVCFLIDGEKLITGDTLFVGKVSKSSPCNKQMMKEFFESLHDRVMTLDDHIEVWPSHDVGEQPSSTIGDERENNKVLQMNFEDFWRRRWLGNKWGLPENG